MLILMNGKSYLIPILVNLIKEEQIQRIDIIQSISFYHRTSQYVAFKINEPCHKKNSFLPMRKHRRRTAVQ